jgi:Holliday junction DNA helicase RuvB
VRLNYYTEDELKEIVKRGARVLQMRMTPDGAREVARRSRGTPRVAGRLLRRVRDFAAVGGVHEVTRDIAGTALNQLEVDTVGLDAMDHRYLRCIAENYGGGPVGIETIAAALSEGKDAIEEVVEPYLLQQGFIGRTPRGRVLTVKAFRHLDIAIPPVMREGQLPLFDGSRED